MIGDHYICGLSNTCTLYMTKCICKCVLVSFGGNILNKSLKKEYKLIKLLIDFFTCNVLRLLCEFNF